MIYAFTLAVVVSGIPFAVLNICDNLPFVPSNTVWQGVSVMPHLGVVSRTVVKLE